MYTGRSGLIIAVALGITTLLAACDGDEAEKQPVVVEDTLSNMLLQSDSEVYATWDEFYRQDDLTFAIDSFMKVDTVNGQLFTQSFKPDADYFKRFGKLLVYNADSSIFIDAYSTTWIVEPDAKGTLYAREGEVDQEVAIVNTKTNVRTRLLFCGPSCQVQKAFWYSDDIVGIMGLMGEYADEYYTPTIWFVNIHNGVTIPYEYHSSVSLVHAHDFMKKHMESKGVKVQY